MNKEILTESSKGCLYYMLPKELFSSEKYESLSLSAKVLYALMYDRSRLSAVNGWKDKNGKVYIYYTIEEITKMLSCGRNYAHKVLDELDCKTGIGLIERKKQGLGKPNKIYISPLPVCEAAKASDNKIQPV